MSHSVTVEPRDLGAQLGLRKRSVKRIFRRETAVRELIEARRADVKLREPIDRYGISESSVKRILRQVRITEVC